MTLLKRVKPCELKLSSNWLNWHKTEETEEKKDLQKKKGTVFSYFIFFTTIWSTIIIIYLFIQVQFIQEATVQIWT